MICPACHLHFEVAPPSLPSPDQAAVTFIGAPTHQPFNVTAEGRKEPNLIILLELSLSSLNISPFQRG